MVRTLLDAGADVHAVNSTKRTALHYAASKGHEDVIRLLVQAGALLGPVPFVSMRYQCCSLTRTLEVWLLRLLQ